jgi:hypothetical protein
MTDPATPSEPQPGWEPQTPQEPAAEAPEQVAPVDPYGPPPAQPLPQAQPYPGYGQYQQPAPYAYGYAYTPPTAQQLREDKRGLAGGALVCSIAGVITCGLGTIAGVIMGHIAYSQAKRGESGGEGLALSAIIVGYVVMALWVGFIAFSIIEWGAEANWDYTR